MGQRNKFAFDRDTASRKVFPAALATLLVFILSRSALAAPEPARGYSIFQGTMADMTYTELEQAVHSGAIALWGLGVIEEHGPHLPLATDVYMPTAYLREVQRLLAEKKIASVIVPAYYWGVNQVTGSFPGSIDVRPEVMVELMLDVFKSLGRAGFKEVYCITGHGDAAHNRAIVEGVRRGNQSDGIRAYMALPRTLVSRLQLDPKEAHLVIAA
ncbi:MAG: creatininase family protein, partial [Steroidobacteraceae bacterium]